MTIKCKRGNLVEKQNFKQSKHFYYILLMAQYKAA